MEASKAIEILTSLLADRQDLASLDLGTAVKLGIEALKRIQNCRLHPGAPMYRTLPGEIMPEREGNPFSLLQYIRPTWRRKATT